MTIRSSERAKSGRGSIDQETDVSTARGVAIVTGASRGIGRATAVKLAEIGFDVAITARTRREGDGRTEASSVHEHEDDQRPIPGSLESTAETIEATGRRALEIEMDLLDVDAVSKVPRRVLDEWGRIDVLVNNAIAKGAGTMDRLLDLSTESMSRMFTANFVHQVVLTQKVLPTMIEQRKGRVVNLVSGSARIDPVAPAGEGGWGIAYAASKAAFGRVAGGINAEFGPEVLAFNVDPGHVVTEASRAFGRVNVFDDYGDDSPEMTSGVIAWLATSADASSLLGKWIYAPRQHAAMHAS
jgi:NAD(P)-dependent dehydrogenase (short-subunit alcohol dehydrogenase family)